jgi:dipeptidyl aminopeptidase/acylaminoacyl peptidase
MWRLSSVVAACWLTGCPFVGSVDAGDVDLDGGLATGRDAGVTVDAGPPVPVGPDPTCRRDGCLLSMESWGDYTEADLRPFVPSSVPLDNGYRVRRIVFRTDGRTARAVVTLPLRVAPAGGLHIAVNNPGTVGLADICAAGEGVYGAGLSGLFGARGLIGVAVDYPGLGTDGEHPYLVKDVEGKASLDAIRATLQLAAWLDAQASGRAVITGLSQGGHATLAAAELHRSYAPELDIAAFAVAGPASVWLEHWQGDLFVAGPHHVYTAMLTWAWSTHLGLGPSAAFPDDVVTAIEGPLTSTACLAGTTPTLFDVVPADPASLFDLDYLAAWQSGQFDALPAFDQAWTDNRVGGWNTSATELLVLQGADDDVVLPHHTAELVEALEASGAIVDHRVIEGGGHIDVAFNALAVEQLAMEDALTWLKTRLEGEGNR